MEHKCPRCGYEGEPIEFDEVFALKVAMGIAAPRTNNPETQAEYNRCMRELLDSMPQTPSSQTQQKEK